MSRDGILEAVRTIIRTELEVPDAEVTYCTVVDDFPDWDSVAHVRIIVAVESRFNIIFEPEEYSEFANVGEMVESIARKVTRGGHSV